MVPVIRHADRRSLLDLAREVDRLGVAAKNGRVSQRDLGGSTFTITSLGALGGIVGHAHRQLSRGGHPGHPQDRQAAGGGRRQDRHPRHDEPVAVGGSPPGRRLRRRHLRGRDEGLAGNARASSSSTGRRPMAQAQPTAKVRSGQLTCDGEVEIWSDEDYARATGLLQILDENGQADPARVPEPAAGEAGSPVRGHADEPAARRAAAAAAAPGPHQPLLRGARTGGRPDRRAPRPSRRPTTSCRGCAKARRPSTAACRSTHVPRADPGHRPRRRPRSPDALPRWLGGHPARQHLVVRGLADPARRRPGAGRPRSARNGTVALCFFGDGATSEDDFHAGLNFAAVYKRAGGAGLPEQPVGHLDPGRRADPLGDPGGQGTGLRRAFGARRRQRRAGHVRHHQGRGGRGPRRRRPHLHRGGDLPPGRALERRRSHALPRRRRSRHLAETRSLAALRRAGWPTASSCPPRPRPAARQRIPTPSAAAIAEAGSGRPAARGEPVRRRLRPPDLAARGAEGRARTRRAPS